MLLILEIEAVIHVRHFMYVTLPTYIYGGLGIASNHLRAGTHPLLLVSSPHFQIHPLIKEVRSENPPETLTP